MSPNHQYTILKYTMKYKSLIFLAVFFRLTSYDDAACCLAAATLCEGTDSRI